MKNIFDLTSQMKWINNYGMKSTSNSITGIYFLALSKEICPPIFDKLQALKTNFSVQLNEVDDMENQEKSKNTCYKLITSSRIEML